MRKTAKHRFKLEPPPGLKLYTRSKRDRRKGPRRETNAVVLATAKAMAVEKDPKSRRALMAYLKYILAHNVRAAAALLKFVLEVEEREHRLSAPRNGGDARK